MRSRATATCRCVSSASPFFPRPSGTSSEMNLLWNKSSRSKSMLQCGGLQRCESLNMSPYELSSFSATPSSTALRKAATSTSPSLALLPFFTAFFGSSPTALAVLVTAGNTEVVVEVVSASIGVGMASSTGDTSSRRSSMAPSTSSPTSAGVGGMSTRRTGSAELISRNKSDISSSSFTSKTSSNILFSSYFQCPDSANMANAPNLCCPSMIPKSFDFG
mmetsp:Transcript_1725/g.2412  ORF Transcript_1725/g.2412 Transcript_1725/m.2412 type:complete len:219 (-) Transcript_1725:445-1101(-)